MNKTLQQKIEEAVNKFGQIICIPNGYFDEVIVRFGRGIRRQEKTLHRGQFINPEDFIKKLTAIAEQATEEALEGCSEALKDIFLMSGTMEDYNLGFNDAAEKCRKAVADQQAKEKEFRKL